MPVPGGGCAGLGGWLGAGLAGRYAGVAEEGGDGGTGRSADWPGASSVPKYNPSPSHAPTGDALYTSFKDVALSQLPHADNLIGDIDVADPAEPRLHDLGHIKPRCTGA